MIVRYLEDLMVFSGWIRELIELHFNGVLGIKIEMHVKDVSGRECDLIICRDGTSILCELKSLSLSEVVKQLTERQGFTYKYAVLNLHVHTIIDALLKNEVLLAKIIADRIGVVSGLDDIVILRSKARKPYCYSQVKTLLKAMQVQGAEIDDVVSRGVCNC